MDTSPTPRFNQAPNSSCGTLMGYRRADPDRPAPVSGFLSRPRRPIVLRSTSVRMKQPPLFFAPFSNARAKHQQGQLTALTPGQVTVCFSRTSSPP